MNLYNHSFISLSDLQCTERMPKSQDRLQFKDILSSPSVIFGRNCDQLATKSSENKRSLLSVLTPGSSTSCLHNKKRKINANDQKLLPVHTHLQTNNFSIAVNSGIPVKNEPLQINNERDYSFYVQIISYEAVYNKISSEIVKTMYDMKEKNNEDTSSKSNYFNNLNLMPQKPLAKSENINLLGDLLSNLAVNEKINKGVFPHKAVLMENDDSRLQLLFLLNSLKKKTISQLYCGSNKSLFMSQLQKNSKPIKKKYYFLGKGCYGKVKFAMSYDVAPYALVNGRLIAVKKMLLTKESDFCALINEYKCMKKLNDTNISPFVHGCVQSKNYDGKDIGLIFMDIFTGYHKWRDLMHIFEEKKFQPIVCFKLYEKIMLSVQAIHNSSIYHRDLKWGNIVVTENFKEIKIMDFGMATEKNVDKYYFGESTPLYVAPECAYVKSNICSSLIDIYALGIIALTLFATPRVNTYCFPYNENNWFELFDNKISNDVIINSLKSYQFLISSAESLIKMMLSVDPLGRPCLQFILSFINKMIKEFEDMDKNCDFRTELNLII